VDINISVKLHKDGKGWQHKEHTVQEDSAVYSNVPADSSIFCICPFPLRCKLEQKFFSISQTSTVSEI
jgi:hypothetical protein